MKKFSYTINGNKYDVVIKNIDGNNASVEVNGKDYDVVLDRPAPVAHTAQPAPTAPRETAAPTPEVRNEPKPQATPAPAPASAATGTGSAKAVISPLPGVIISVLVNQGDAVKKGQKIIVLEAMKMENDIKADRDGTVTAINVAKGDSVQEGDPLITIG